MSLLQVNWRPSPRNLRVFGVACVLVFGALALVAALRQTVFGVDVSAEGARSAWQVLLAVSASSAILTVVAPSALWPPYVVLTAVTLPIGFVVSIVVLLVVFFGLFAPIGLVARLLGWDPMKRGFDRTAETYWSPRGPTNPAKRYFRQY